MTSKTAIHRLVVSAVFLAVAGAVGAAAMLSSASSEVLIVVLAALNVAMFLFPMAHRM